VDLFGSRKRQSPLTFIEALNPIVEQQTVHTFVWFLRAAMTTVSCSYQRLTPEQIQAPRFWKILGY
jgi:hypothetical protein